MQSVKRYFKDEKGTAAAEFVIIFPVMFFMILGIWDLGNGLWIGQKLIKTSNMVADLLARETEVTDAELAQAFEAGRLALQPFSDTTLTIEVYSFSFDEDGNASLVWDEGYNTSPNENFSDEVEDLGTDGSLIVRVNYQYDPAFSGFLIPVINMQETVYVKGRQVDVVNRI